MPDSVAYVAPYAFEYCSGLSNVAMGNGVTAIDSYAFDGCSGLTSIMIPSSVKAIADYAFLDCSGLKNVSIPRSVTAIGDYAFADCTSLEHARLPALFKIADNIDKIFRNCPAYSSDNVVYWDFNVKVVGGNAWAYTVSAGGATVGGGAWNLAIATSTSGAIAIPSKLDGYPVTAIDVSAFYDCSGLAKVTIPNSVTNIGSCAFWGCSGLASITIPASVTRIGDSTFKRCSSMADVYCYANPVSLKWGVVIEDFMKDWQTKIHVFEEYLLAYEAKFDSKIRATFVGDLDQCIVSFNANGGKTSETKRKVRKNLAVGTLPKSTKKGYTLKGWYTKKSGGSKMAASTKITKNATYYAQWTANKYKIKFHKNGGTGTMKALSATYDKNVSLRANAFKRTGYKFKGWAKTKKGKVAYKNKAKVKNLTTVNDRVVTLYAVWKKAK